MNEEGVVNVKEGLALHLTGCLDVSGEYKPLSNECI